MSPTKNTVFWVLLRKGLNTPTNQGKNGKQVKVIMTLVDNQWRYAHGHINTPNPSNFLSLSTHPIFPVVFPILSLFFSSLSLSLSLSFFVLHMWCYQPSSFCYQGHLLDRLQLSVRIWNPLWKNKWKTPKTNGVGEKRLSIFFSILLPACPSSSLAYILAGLSTLPKNDSFWSLQRHLSVI